MRPQDLARRLDPRRPAPVRLILVFALVMAITTLSDPFELPATLVA